MENTNNPFSAARYKAEILEELYEHLCVRENWDCKEYKKVGERPKTEWDSENHCSREVYDEEGNLVMEDVHDYVSIPRDEMSDVQLFKSEAYAEVKKDLLKLA